MIDRSLPLIDLHRHLDGNVRLETILDLAQQHGIALPARDVEGLRRHVEVDGRADSVMAFIGRFRWLREVMADPAACRRIAHENVADARLEGLDHVELRFSPWFMAERYGLNPAEVVEAVLDGIDAGRRDYRVGVGVIGILSRTYGPTIAERELATLLAHRGRLVALDLAGDEARMPAGLFARHFARARDAGLQVTVHAGEAAGAQSVWDAIRELGATRIGHAVRAIDDPRLIEYMREHDIGIEANLTSNVQTSTVPDYAAHPIKRFLNFGLLATLNTDDPVISGIDLRHEYEVAAKAAGLTREHVRQAQENALRLAFLPEATKRELEQSKARGRAPRA